MHMFDAYKLKPGYKDLTGREMRDELLASVPKKKMPLQVKIAILVLSSFVGTVIGCLLAWAPVFLAVLVLLGVVSWAGVTLSNYF